MTGLALIQHGLQLALVASVDPSSEQLGGALSAAHQNAQLAGSLEERLEWRRAFEDEVRRQLHLGHAVAVPRLQRLTFGWAEDRHQAAYPVGAAALQDGCAQAIGGGLQGGHVVDRQEGIVRFAEANTGALELLGDE